MLGLAKGFVIAIFVGIFFAIGMKDYKPFLWIVGSFIVIKVVWHFLTK